MKNSKVLIIAGILITFFSLFIPGSLYDYLYYHSWSQGRLDAIIPTIRTVGILISCYGFILLLKAKPEDK